MHLSMNLQSKPTPFSCVPCSQEGWLDVAVYYTGDAKPSLLRIERLAETEELALPKRFSGDSVEELYQVRRTTASPVNIKKASGLMTPERRCAIAKLDAIPLNCPLTDNATM